MPQQLYNTLTNRQAPFVPGDPSRVLFYTCGPTVYDFAHIIQIRTSVYLKPLLREAWFVPETKPVTELLQESKTQNQTRR